MPQRDKSLKKMKLEAKKAGYGVRKWAAVAGLPYQVVYRRLQNEKSVLLDEYRRLEAALLKIQNG